MHPRNPYKSLDFSELAHSYPLLQNFLIQRDGRSRTQATIDFKDPAAVRCLQEAVLSRDFNLKLNFPEDKLCPPVPNRLNYVLWIQDIVQETLKCFDMDVPDEIVGIDIGTGASAIYPLLGIRVEPLWKFIGTDISESSYATAKQNVFQNDLGAQIELLLVEPGNPILQPMHLYPKRKFAFTMCNPPFYASEAEVASSAATKSDVPSSVCTGALHEMITEGGEEAFVLRMLNESVSESLRSRCWWYTSMVGKLSTLSVIVERLKELDLDNYAITELAQGQTRRWVIAWSFTEVRLQDALARNMPTTQRSLLPPPNEMRHFLQIGGIVSACSLESTVRKSIDGIGGINVEVSDNGRRVRMSASHNSWSRAARRAKAKPAQDHPKDIACTSDGVVLDVSFETTASSGSPGGILIGRWQRGRERALFESLWGHLCRQISRKIESGPENTSSRKRSYVESQDGVLGIHPNDTKKVKADEQTL